MIDGASVATAVFEAVVSATPVLEVVVSATPVLEVVVSATPVLEVVVPPQADGCEYRRLPPLPRGSRENRATSTT